MLNITLDLDTGLAKLAIATTIKVGAQVPVTISTFRGTVPTSPGASPAFELGLGTEATPPVLKAYLATFTAENDHTFTGMLDANDTRLVTFMAGKGTVNFGIEVAWTVAGELQIAPSFTVPVQSRIIPSDPTSEGGPDFYTAAEVDALLDGFDAGASTFAALSDKTSAALPTINTPLANALAAKLDATRGVRFATGTLLSPGDGGVSFSTTPGADDPAEVSTVVLDFASYDGHSVLHLFNGDGSDWLDGGSTIVGDGTPGVIPASLPSQGGFGIVRSGTVATYVHGETGVVDYTGLHLVSAPVTSVELAPLVAGKTLVLLSPHIIGVADSASAWAGVINIKSGDSILIQLTPADFADGNVIVPRAGIIVTPLLMGIAEQPLTATFVPAGDVYADMVGGSVTLKLPYLTV